MRIVVGVLQEQRATHFQNKFYSAICQIWITDSKRREERAEVFVFYFLRSAMGCKRWNWHSHRGAGGEWRENRRGGNQLGIPPSLNCRPGCVAFQIFHFWSSRQRPSLASVLKIKAQNKTSAGCIFWLYFDLEMVGMCFMGEQPLLIRAHTPHST